MRYPQLKNVLWLQFPKMGHRLSLTSSKNSLTTTTTNSVDVKAESRRSNSSSKDDPEIVAAMARPQRRHRRHQSTALVSNAGPGSGGGVGGRVITKGSASLPPPSPVKGGRGAAVRGGAKRFLSGIVSASHSCTPQKMLMKSKKRSRSISPKVSNKIKVGAFVSNQFETLMTNPCPSVFPFSASQKFASC